MKADLKQCPQCSQYIPITGLADHIATHQRYGTGWQHRQPRVATANAANQSSALPQEPKSEPISISVLTSEQPEEGGIFLDLLLQLAESALSERNAEIFARRFGLLGDKGQTLQEIGQAFGVSRERIRQILNKSLRMVNTRAKRQLRKGQLDEPGARLEQLIRNAIRPDEEGEDERMMALCTEELPHLHPVKNAAPLIGYFLGGVKASGKYQQLVGKLYRAQLRQARQAAYENHLAEKQSQQVETMLQSVVWPRRSTLINSSEAAKFTRQREISEDSIGETGAFFSTKLQREVTFESNLERYFLEFLESVDDVVFYQEQPLKIPFRQNGRTAYYFPDILFVLNDGRAVVVEIKPRNEMALFHNWTKWAALRSYCQEQGYGFLVTDGRYSMQHVAQRQVRDSTRLALLTALDNGPLDWQAYKKLRKKCDIKTYELYALIIQERLMWELRPFLLKKEMV